MADTNFSPEQREEVLSIIRSEMLEIFQYVKSRTGETLVSTSDKFLGKGPAIDYFIEAVSGRLNLDS